MAREYCQTSAQSAGPLRQYCPAKPGAVQAHAWHRGEGRVRGRLRARGTRRANRVTELGEAKGRGAVRVSKSDLRSYRSVRERAGSYAWQKYYYRGAKRQTKNLLFLDRAEALARWSGPRPVANPGSLTAPFVRGCAPWSRGRISTRRSRRWRRKARRDCRPPPSRWWREGRGRSL